MHMKSTRRSTPAPASKDKEGPQAPKPLFGPSERVHLHRDSPVPLYHQMETAILERIHAEAAVGRMLPRELDLAEIFGVSRITVRWAPTSSV